MPFTIQSDRTRVIFDVVDGKVRIGLKQDEPGFSIDLGPLDVEVDAERLADFQKISNLDFNISGDGQDELRSAGRALRPRADFMFTYIKPVMEDFVKWLVRSRETTNFTYDLTSDSMEYLAHTLCVVTGQPYDTIRGYMEEPAADTALHDHIRNTTRNSRHWWAADDVVRFGRRLGWYALVRAIKPRVVIETGVDKGLGAVLLASAVLRNRSEGHEGIYRGTDIRTTAGYLLSGPYKEAGHVLYGDSIESLTAFGQPIDLFINDSDHSADYEYREYQTIEGKLTPESVVVSDNGHVTAKLAKFARETDRRFVYFQEQPANHWYPGGGLGIAFR